MAATPPLSPIEHPRTFRQMAEGHSVRELMASLRMASQSIRSAKDDPSRLSLGDVFRLAHLNREPVEQVLAELVHEIRQLPAAAQPVQAS